MNWTGVRERVTAIAKGRNAFGPVLTEDEIAQAEAQYGVPFPEEYRSFLAEVGTGGPGPDCALTPPLLKNGLWYCCWGLELAVMDSSGPFTEDEDWPARQLATLRAAGHDPGPPDEEGSYLEDYRKAFGGDAGEAAWHLERDRGALVIADHGCAMWSFLITVGPRRGEIRFRQDGLNSAYEPQFDAQGNRHTFASWYLEWLEQRGLSFPAPLTRWRNSG